MPWECKSCGTSVEEDTTPVCPTCQVRKTAWTMQDQTRTFVVASRRRVEFLRGTCEVSQSEDVCSAELVEAQFALVIEKAEALEYANQGKLPPTYCVLTARLHPGSATDLTVTLSVNYDVEEVDDLPFPTDRPADLPDSGLVDVRFLFVHGPETELPGFPDMHVVDLGEDTARGFAPSVEVTALKKRPKLLPTVAPPLGYLSVELRDASGTVPLANRKVSVELPEGPLELETDDQGRLFHADIPFADYELSLEGQRVFAPAVAAPSEVHESRVPGVSLGFVRLVVRGAHGYPLSEHEVALTSSSGERVTGTTDAEGVLRLDEPLPPGGATLEVDGQSIPVTLPATPDGLVIAVAQPLAELLE